MHVEYDWLIMGLIKFHCLLNKEFILGMQLSYVLSLQLILLILKFGYIKKPMVFCCLTNKFMTMLYFTSLPRGVFS